MKTRLKFSTDVGTLTLTKGNVSPVNVNSTLVTVKLQFPENSQKLLFIEFPVKKELFSSVSWNLFRNFIHDNHLCKNIILKSLVLFSQWAFLLKRMIKLP